MDIYFDCPCGHRHSEHNWHGDTLTVSSCTRCDCWTYHGHRADGEPHTVVRSGQVAPTAEMLRWGNEDVGLWAGEG